MLSKLDKQGKVIRHNFKFGSRFLFNNELCISYLKFYLLFFSIFKWFSFMCFWLTISHNSRILWVYLSKIERYILYLKLVKQIRHQGTNLDGRNSISGHAMDKKGQIQVPTWIQDINKGVKLQLMRDNYTGKK